MSFASQSAKHDAIKHNHTLRTVEIEMLRSEHARSIALYMIYMRQFNRIYVDEHNHN